ncbi:MAG: hypothetical protein Q8N09_07885 [Thermodesulfovibrionia bacterium]|nr:hypothetical protein [Thermodesulfovibrionia bacterium]
MENIGKKGCVIYGVRFGQTAVELGFITKEQLKKALCQQVENDLAHKPHRLLGEICFQNGWMTSKQIEIVLNKLLEDTRKNEVT